MRKINALLAIILLSVGALMSASCQKWLSGQDDTTNVTLTFDINSDGADASTKSSYTSGWDTFHTITVAFYQTSNGAKVAEGSVSGSVITLSAVPNVSCNVYAIANQPDWVWPSNVSSGFSTCSGFSVASINANGCPMSGTASWSAGSTSVTIGLDRLVSKYIIRPNSTYDYGEWVTEMATIVDGAETVKPFSQNTVSGSIGNDYEEFEEAPGEIILYAPENIGGNTKITLEGAWVAGGVRRPENYTISLGNNNVRNMSYVVKLNAGDTYEWEDDFPSGGYDNRSLTFSENPVSVSYTTQATVTLTPSHSDLWYYCNVDQTARAAAGLQFKVGSGSWSNYLSDYDGTQTLQVKTSYTGAATKSISLQFRSYDDLNKLLGTLVINASNQVQEIGFSVTNISTSSGVYQPAVRLDSGWTLCQTYLSAYLDTEIDCELKLEYEYSTGGDGSYDTTRTTTCVMGAYTLRDLYQYGYSNCYDEEFEHDDSDYYGQVFEKELILYCPSAMISALGNASLDFVLSSPSDATCNVIASD